jgi:hypothetical protein
VVADEIINFHRKEYLHKRRKRPQRILKGDINNGGKNTTQHPKPKKMRR